jgi:hypothetical protein
MDDAEVASAREAVATMRPLRDQMRKDWGHHREPEEVLDEAVGELMAEVDRLRTGVMTAEVHGEMIVRMRESVWLRGEAERGQLRTVVDALRTWRDAEMRLTTADIVADISDHREQAETARQDLWLTLARWEETIDG